MAGARLSLLLYIGCNQIPRAAPPPPHPRCPPVSQGGGVGAVCIGMLHLVLNPDSTAPTAQTSRPVSNWMYERASAASYSWRAPPSGHIYAYIWPTGVGLVKAGIYVAHGVRAVLAT